MATPAEPAATNPPSAATAADATPRAASSCAPELSALSGVACDLREQLGDQRGTLVIASGITGEPKLERATALAERITRVIAGGLGGTAHPKQTTRGAAQLVARSAARFVYLELRLQRGRLEVTADVYQPVRGFWARVRRPRPEPLKHAFASRALDAELRSFLPSVPLVAAIPLKLPSPEPAVLALACGDIDGDSALELVVVGRSAIQVGRVRAKRFVASARRTWASLSPIAAAPLRQPIASASLVPGRHVDVGTTDRAKGFRLNVKLEPVAPLAAPIPWPGHGCVEVYDAWLGRVERPCQPGDQPSAVPSFDYRGDTIAGARIIDRAGALRQYRALRSASDGRVDLRSDKGGRAALPNLGAQLALGDLDGDGAPELVASTPTLVPRSDALQVFSWQEPAAPVERYRLAAPGGVSAVTTCPADGAERAMLVAAVGDELWLVR